MLRHTLHHLPHCDSVTAFHSQAGSRHVGDFIHEVSATVFIHRCAPTNTIVHVDKWERFLVRVLAISGELLLVEHTQTWNLFKMRLHVLSGSPPGCFVFFSNLAKTSFIAQDLAHLGKPSISPACPKS